MAGVDKVVLVVVGNIVVAFFQFLGCEWPFWQQNVVANFSQKGYDYLLE